MRKRRSNFAALTFCYFIAFHICFYHPHFGKIRKKSAYGLVCVDPARLAVYILSPNDQDDTIWRNTEVGI